MSLAGLPPPRYDDAGTLAAVLPSVLTSLGATGYAVNGTLEMLPSRRAVVVLVDGMGDDLLRRRGGHAPFLRGHLPAAYRIDCGFPSTTATSMGTFGTGLPPGSHGLVGYEVLVPEADRILNELSWENGPDPVRWQPCPTVFEVAEQQGIAVTRVGPGYFDGSGLTNAALRGGRFVAAADLDARVQAALDAVRASSRALVYLYWGDLDKVGHVFGCESWEWGDELESIDAALRRLVEQVPSDTAVHVTADHGMVDSPHELRIDLADHPDLLQGVRHVGGEPRCLQLYCAPGSAPDVLATWRARVGERAWISSRHETVAAGWFGAVRPEVTARIGDVLVAMKDTFAVVHTGHTRPEILALRGLHGSVTPQERSIPLVRFPARDG